MANAESGAKTAADGLLMEKCKVKFVINVGSLSIAAGEIASQPGKYIVWLRDLNNGETVWERAFDKESHAVAFTCDAAFPKGIERDE